MQFTSRNSDTPETKRNQGKKKAVIAAVAAIVLTAGAWLAYASFGSSDTYEFFPFQYDEGKDPANQDVYASLVAYGPNTASQYFPGGYAMYPLTLLDDPLSFVTGRRRIDRFEILRPAVQPDESFADPASTRDIVYQFSWTDKDGRQIASRIHGNWYQWNAGWVDVMPAIIDNAKDVTGIPNGWGDPDAKKIAISAIDPQLIGDAPVVIRTFWGDDSDQNWNSAYTDITKKFAFRALNAQISKFGVAKTDGTLWGPDGTIATNNLWKANFATMWVRSGIPAYDLTYHAVVDSDVTDLKILTVDMDQLRIDSNAKPSNWNTYIDVSMYGYDGNVRKPINQDYRFIDGELDTSIFRIAPYKDLATAQSGINDGKGLPGERIPGLGTYTRYDIGPSGSLDFYSPIPCKNRSVPIGNHNFKDCFTNSAEGALEGIRPEFRNAFMTHPGITQHRVLLGSKPYNGKRFLDFTAHNVSAPDGGNVFAFASSEFLWTRKEPQPKNPDIPNPSKSCDPNDPNAICPDASTGSGVVGKTTMQRDLATPNGRHDFADDGKATASGALHTYKTQVCNWTTAKAERVLVKLNLPNKVALVWSGSSDLSGSTLVVDGSRLPGDSTGTVLAMGNFTQEISFGDLDPDACKYVTYQAKVDVNALPGDEFKVKNQFKYDDNAYKDTNEVRNFILDWDVDCSIRLDSVPLSGSDVSWNDYISYTVTCQNNGTTPIGSGSIDCARQKDTSETTCTIGTCTPESISNLQPGAFHQYVYSVKVRSGVADQTHLLNSCVADYDTQQKTSNTTDHTVVVPSTDAICGGKQTFSIYTPRSKLLNSPDGNPRADGLDKTEVVYSQEYTGAHKDYVYPNTSSTSGGFVQTTGTPCDAWENTAWQSARNVPYTPGAYFYNVNSVDTSPSDGIPNPGSSDVTLPVTTTLPSGIPKTVLSAGSLTPSFKIPWGVANDWFNNGGTFTLPSGTTVQRALVNGTDGKITSNLNGNFRLDKWQYVPYQARECIYGFWGYSVAYVYKYRWQMTESTMCPMSASAETTVNVAGSTGWWRTRNGDVHTNNAITSDGTTANTYNLGDGYGSVKSAPKSYTPPGSYHSDYFVSTNSSTSNLSSKRAWYTIRELPFGKGTVYDREKNPRDYYSDMLDKQKFGKVVRDGLPNPVRSLDLTLNTIYYYPGDLTLESPTWTVQISGNKATTVVEGNLYVNSNMAYAGSTQIPELLTYLGIVVKGSVYVAPKVTSTVWIWHVDGTVHSGIATQTWKHFGQIGAKAFDLQRKAPEYGAGKEVNAPSEDFMFDDQIYVTIPPGFAQLDDWQWAFMGNVNQFTGNVENWWEEK